MPYYGNLKQCYMHKELHGLIVCQQRFLVLLMLHKLVFLNAKRKTYANKVV